ncbi:heavy metal transport/detoxification protein, partial [Ramicandelaber brevisporus]
MEAAPHYLEVAISSSLDISQPGRQVASRFAVDGITCASCVEPIRSALMAMRGVTDVSVSIIDGEVTVKHDDAVAAKEAISSAIADVGFEPRFIEQTITRAAQAATDGSDARSTITAKDAADDTVATNRFAVSGISCASCVAPIRSGLLALAGVLDVSVSVIDGEVTVQHDTAQVGPRDLIAAFGDLGFDATLIQQAHAEAARRRQQQDKHLRDARNRFLVSLALAIPTFILAMVIDMMLPEHNPARMAIMRPITGSEGSWPILT